MITNLAIKNYALIDEINVQFHTGHTIITGETGAGKSILLGALALILGKRADLGSVKNTSEKCVVEAVFNLSGHSLQDVFEENELDYEPETIVRREILPGGKSRAFVNDTPVTLMQLQALAIHLVDIHSQHETLALVSENFQMEVIDALAGNSSLLTTYSDYLVRFSELSETVSALQAEKETVVKELDYNTFLYEELKEASLSGTNQQELEETFETLNNTEAIQEGLSHALKLLLEEPIGTLETSKEARIVLGKLQKYSSGFSGYWERLNSLIIELEDICEGLQDTVASVEADPQKLFEIQAKLQTLYKLQQKHSATSVEELLEIQKQLENKIDGALSLDERIANLKRELKACRDATMQVALKLHENRIEAIPKLKEKLEVILQDLGLPNARFKFELTPLEAFRKNGIDSLELLFTANKGLAFGPLKKVASGGELSRIMLAVKAVLARYKKLPTIIFDEIDTGVSGEVANKMAGIMNAMSKTMQLLSITHLPQIAAKGDHHIKVYKEDVEEVTVTLLRKLDEEERIVEIAQMIGGRKVTDAALANAKELLN